eukprot:5185170-Prorocentrum_lima.AAC.1
MYFLTSAQDTVIACHGKVANVLKQLRQPSLRRYLTTSRDETARYEPESRYLGWEPTDTPHN